ncbi:MAG: type II toxin-antitoxin system prevent-host-death family antitoxin [Moraxella sp.]|nr:type II toxin-antitoxin system prevent-host-death family antitoxin [Moraxella sp.]
MTVMTSRRFNQNTSLAQKYAQTAPVIITNRGKPAYVLIRYEDYQAPKTTQNALEALMALVHPDVSDVGFPLRPRSKAQRKPVNFGG